MPTYDFRCPGGHEFERFYRKMSDAPGEVSCPDCGAVAVRQVSGGAGLLFKGSGFYITDYGKDGKKDQRAAAEKKKSADTAESKSSESKSSDAPSPTTGESAKSTAKPEPAESKRKPSSGSTGTE
jgi:putative FmdB family regulatory protein